MHDRRMAIHILHADLTVSNIPCNDLTAHADARENRRNKEKQEHWELHEEAHAMCGVRRCLLALSFEYEINRAFPATLSDA